MTKEKAKDSGAPSTKKSLIKKFTPLLIGVVLVGAGVAGGIMIGAKKQAPHVDPNIPQLVVRTDAAHQSVSAAKDDKSRYQASYFSFEQPFTSNLEGSDNYVQLSLGLATYYDQRVIDNAKQHEMAIRSAMLLRLSEQDADVLATPEGKATLQRDLAAVANRVLKDKTGFGGIDNVYFTGFVVQ